MEADPLHQHFKYQRRDDVFFGVLAWSAYGDDIGFLIKLKFFNY